MERVIQTQLVAFLDENYQQMYFLSVTDLASLYY